MGITVREALTVGGLQSGQVLAGERGLDNIIDSVCVLEQPPYRRWLRPNEFMLTTFFCLKDDLKGQITSIEELANANTAALAIHLGNFGYKVPRALMTRADELGFPLIQIPSDMSYVDIITPLMASILDRQNYLLHRSQEIHNRLIDLVLAGGDVQAVVDALCALLKRQVVVSGPDGEIMQVSRGKGVNLRSAGEQLDTDAARTAFRCAFTAGIRDHEPVGIARLATARGDVRAFYLPVRLGKSQSALLSVLDPGDTDFDQMDIAALRQGMLAISVVMLKEQAVHLAERRMRNDLFRDLLSDSTSTKPGLLERAQDVGWDLTHKHVAVVIDPSGAEAGQREVVGDADNQPLSTCDAVYAVATRLAQERNPRSIVMQKDGLVVILPHIQGEFQREDAIHEARSIANAIREGCASTNPFSRPVGGIGRAYENLGELSKSYNEARRALALRQEAHLTQPLVQFDEVVVFEVLRQLGAKADGADALLLTIQPLLDYDRHKGSELVRTIECYFDCGQRLDEVARRLDMHPNSVKYRLRRAKEILGFDLFQSNFQMTVHLATKLARMV